MKKIAFYGKGGIGKSTTVSNVSMALAGMGYTVMQIGCDPKADSTINLTKGERIPTILTTMTEKGNSIGLCDIVFKGSGGVFCVEAGGPKPGYGCAGRGIITAFEQLELLGAYETYKPDVVIYDVLGDVVCGGFALPIRKGYADEVYIVTSGEKMALYAADNIRQSVMNNSFRGYAKIKGLILNSRNTANEAKVVKEAAEEMGIEVLIRIPRDNIVQDAEDRGITVIEYDPESEMSRTYQKLANIVIGDGNG
jgi:Nitrogenase subunit NifH (ATPase)